MSTMSYQTRRVMHKVTLINKEVTEDIIQLTKEARLLKQMTDIRKTIISNGAYSIKNMEVQSIKLNNLNVPEWEKKIICDSWNATKKLSHILFKRLDKLNQIILSEGDTDK